jgi:hypothetical protein
MWIVVKMAVQPDPELPGQVRGGFGELHLVRLSGCRDRAVCSTALRFSRGRTRLDSGLSLGYGF